MGALGRVGATALLIVLAFLSFRHGDVWGAVSFSSLLVIAIFGEDIIRGPARAPREPSPLDAWLRPGGED